MVRIERTRTDVPAGAPTALVLPGAAYTVQAMTERGCDVWTIDWHADIDETVRLDMRAFVEASVRRAEAIMPSPPAFVVAKSFGTYAMPYYLGSPVWAVWMTPILSDPVLAGTLARASEGHLAIGGSADPSWRPDLTEGTGARLVTVEGADHVLLRPDGWRESASTQLELIDTAVSHLFGER
jgi:hypothetical protein